MDMPLSLWRVPLGTAQGLIFAIVGIVLGPHLPLLALPRQPLRVRRKIRGAAPGGRLPPPSLSRSTGCPSM
jgi:hypothetical protein